MLSLPLHIESYVPIFHLIFYKYGRELLLVLVIFPLQQKTSKKQKRYHLMTESLLFNNASNRFKFIMTTTRGKTCGLCRRNETKTLPTQKQRTADNMLL